MTHRIRLAAPDDVDPEVVGGSVVPTTRTPGRVTPVTLTILFTDLEGLDTPNLPDARDLVRG